MPSRKYRLSFLITVVVFGPVAALSLWPRPAPGLPEPPPAPRVFVQHYTDDWNVKTGANIKWTAKLGSRSYGGPVVAHGKVFVGTNNNVPRDPKIQGDKGVLMCFRESDGKFLWQAVHDKLESGQVNDYPEQGIASSPAVDGHRLYYVSNRCELVCADVDGVPGTTDARILWQLDMIRELDVFPHNLSVCSPLVVGDLVFVITGNGVDEGHISVPSPNAPSFIAVEKRTGKVRWKNNAPTVRLVNPKEKETARDLMKRGLAVMHGQWASPAYAEADGKPMVVFPGGDGWLYSFNPADGKLLWKFDANPKDSKYAMGGNDTRSDFLATPVIVDNHLFIGTGQDPEHYTGVGHLWCIDVTKQGDVSPELVTDDSVFPPKTKKNPNSAVVWHFGGVLPEAEAEKLGRDVYFGRTMSTVAVHDGLVYAPELAGYLHCLDAKTGELYWTHDLKAAVWSSPRWLDGKVYFGTDDGDMWIFAHGKEKKEPKRLEFGDPIRWHSVAAARGVWFVNTESQLYAIGPP